MSTTHFEYANDRLTLLYTQPFNNGLLTAREYSFETSPFLSRPLKIQSNSTEFDLLQNLHLCTEKSVCATSLGPFGDVGANFLL